MRLDKLLANMGFGSRKGVKVLLKKNQVTVNGTIISDGKLHIDPTQDDINVKDKKVHYQKFIYIMLHKPKGYVSATTDDRDRTVIDLLSNDLNRFNPFPVGRLDKDTEGLLLLTNDGVLAHHLTSPKKGTVKTYYAKIDGYVTDEDIGTFKQGVVLDDGYKTKPAKLTIIREGDISEIKLAITEGKYHHVKRMFNAVDKEVIYLKRLTMGELVLDDGLELGEYRPLKEQEVAYCKSLKNQGDSQKEC